MKFAYTYIYIYIAMIDYLGYDTPAGESDKVTDTTM